MNGRVPALHEILGEGRRVLTGKACVAEPRATRGVHMPWSESSRANPRRGVRNLLDRVPGGDEFLAVRRVDAVVARTGDGRRGDAEVHRARPRGADHPHQAPAGVAPDQAVVHYDAGPAVDHVANRVELDLYLLHPVSLGRVDEGAPPRSGCRMSPCSSLIADTSENPSAMALELSGTLKTTSPVAVAPGPAAGPALAAPGPPTRRTRCCRAGRNRPARRRSGSPAGARASAIQSPGRRRSARIAGRELAGHGSADEVERAGLRGDHHSRAQPAQDQRPEARGCPPRRRACARPRSPGCRRLPPAPARPGSGPRPCPPRSGRSGGPAPRCRSSVVKMAPFSTSSRFSSVALVRFPLWAMARVPQRVLTLQGCALASTVLPVVE